VPELVEGQQKQKTNIMKNILYIPLLLIGLLVTSCQKVIEVPLSTAPPKLVVDASLLWIKGTTGNTQKITLSTTTDYYSNVIPKVSGATVYVTAADNSVFTFDETLHPGEYVCNNFAPVLNTDYVLTIVYKGETYTALETMKPVPPIDKIVQTNNGGLEGTKLQIKTYFTDDAATKDFYMFRYQTSYGAFPSFRIISDDLFQGNQVSGTFGNDKLVPGDHVSINLNGISEQYFNYMNIILSISGGRGGGPFATPSATVRGNVVNNANQNNYPLGYFSLSESDFVDYVVE